VPPTELNARTGEFTPPGMTAQASANSLADVAEGAACSVLLMAPVFQPRLPAVS
jgi:hypothetical protein